MESPKVDCYIFSFFGLHILFLFKHILKIICNTKWLIMYLAKNTIFYGQMFEINWITTLKYSSIMHLSIQK